MNTNNNGYIAKRPVATTKQEALEAISEFFYTFHPVEVKECLRDLLNNAFKADSGMSQADNEDMIYFCKKLEELTEAAFILKE